MGTTLEAWQRLYDTRQSRSRTIVDGVKAIKLDKYGRQNTTMRPDNNGGFIFRYHRTDVVHLASDGYATITTKGWHTVSTFDRIYSLTSVRIYNTSAKDITDQTVRFIDYHETRDGKAPEWVRRSMPFVDGIRFKYKMLHPDDVSKIPSDRRAEYATPSAVARKEFREKWALVKDRITIGVKLGAWAEKYLREAVRVHDMDRVEIAFFMTNQPLTDDQLFALFTRGLCIAPWDKSVEHVVQEMISHIAKRRRELLLSYARTFSMMEQKGGEILRDGYYVREGE